MSKSDAVLKNYAKKSNVEEQTPEKKAKEAKHEAERRVRKAAGEAARMWPTAERP